MKRNNKSFDLIPEYYNVLFYWSFINFQREKLLIEELNKNNYSVNRSSMKEDGIHKIDLIACKNNIKYFIQLKNRKSNLKETERKILIHYSISKNAIPILATKTLKDFNFINLLKNEEIKLFN
ncbi:hypothetical protein [Mycoplasmopsis lipofaciens]|uniref:hypothetical protein n=1 Tax=Mycoplasmopsis lipofaciens TaxID=114884 RepID=UPI001FE17DB9|nr:hypothetical protein [Mycoplasmopsis lipofaciens]